MRVAPLTIVLWVTGCGSPESRGAPPADQPTRTWQYYVAHPAEIETMQNICREWSGAHAPVSSEPAVVGANCRAAAFAKSQRQINP